MIGLITHPFGSLLHSVVRMYYTYVLRDPRDFEPIYVGKGYGKRIWSHWQHMLAGRQGTNRKLYNKLTSIFQAGYSAPIYEKWLECADEKLCLWMERFLIKSIGRKDLCNLSDGGEGPSGAIRSEETLRKMREALRGKPKSALTRQKLKEAWVGRRIKGVSAETRQKQSVARLGKIGKPLSDYHIQKLREANLGKKHSVEHREKIRSANVGRINTEETRQRMSDAAKKWWPIRRVNGSGFGESASCVKLTEKDVLFIRESKCTNQHIATMLGVSNVAVSKIRLGKTWKHLLQTAVVTK
jgi:hypothetical protein